MLSPALRHGLLVLVLPAVVLAGCAAPPTKELSTAQGAIDAARAAGAAEFAREELARAEATLARAHSAVTERDYRAALSHALEAHVEAQVAAKAAVDGRLQARLAADGSTRSSPGKIADVTTQLEAAEAKRVPAAAHAARSGRSTRPRRAEARVQVERGESSEIAAVRGEATAALDETAAALVPPPPRACRGR
ncbi:MAG: DUF4398 domain-containing protein [Vicinamibacterales bacterium]